MVQAGIGFEGLMVRFECNMRTPMARNGDDLLNALPLTLANNKTHNAATSRLFMLVHGANLLGAGGVMASLGKGRLRGKP